MCVYVMSRKEFPTKKFVMERYILLCLNYLYEKCDEIKNQMQKHFPNEKSLCDEIKTLA
jgi:hypothetical protein